MSNRIYKTLVPAFLLFVNFAHADCGDAVERAAANRLQTAMADSAREDGLRAEVVNCGATCGVGLTANNPADAAALQVWVKDTFAQSDVAVCTTGAGVGVGGTNALLTDVALKSKPKVKKKKKSAHRSGGDDESVTVYSTPAAPVDTSNQVVITVSPTGQVGHGIDVGGGIVIPR